MSSSRPLCSQLDQVPDGRRQDHRAGDRRGRLGLDVDLGRVLLHGDLIAGLELALGEDLVLLESGRPSASRSARAAHRGSCAGSRGPASRPPRARPRRSCCRRRRPACSRDQLSLTTSVTAFSSVAPAFRAAPELVRELVDRLRHDRVEDRVRQRRRGARAQRPELELVAGEGERARAVAIAASAAAAAAARASPARGTTPASRARSCPPRSPRRRVPVRPRGRSR